MVLFRRPILTPVRFQLLNVGTLAIEEDKKWNWLQRRKQLKRQRVINVSVLYVRAACKALKAETNLRHWGQKRGKPYVQISQSAQLEREESGCNQILRNTPNMETGKALPPCKDTIVKPH